MADYRSGISAERLTKRYGISKGSVLKLLDSEGVLKPQHRLDSKQKEEIIRLYRTGLSLAKVSAQVGFRPEAVRRVLDEAGEPRRDRYGNQR